MADDSTPTTHRHRTVRRLLLWAACAAWAAAIFAVSSVPGSRIPGKYGEVAHFTEYAILASLLYGALRVDNSPARSAWLALAVASGYAITDEFHQSFVPLRTPDPIDWLTDTAGAATAVTVLYLGRRLFGSKRA